ncbi:MAG: DNA primase [Eubacteriales bacterium]
MYYPEELVEEVRQSNDIIDVIAERVQLEKKGQTHWGLCPFHNEKTPSFSATQHKQMYYCFGCGVGGNVFTFLMEYENYSFPEAIAHLAERARITLPEVEMSEQEQNVRSKRAKIYDISKEAAKFYYAQLRSQNGVIGYEYFKERLLENDTMNQFGLGYAGQSSQGLLQYLRSKSYDVELMKEAGLVNIDERRGAYDKFFNRVIFPIQDVNHKVIGFGGRVMGDGKPKYLNSPETFIFDKSRNLYGLNLARTSRKKYMIICEGYMDVITLHQAGFTEAVASLGTAFTTGQANLLRRYTEEVKLIYDSDEAGIKATLRAIPILKEAGIQAQVISLSPCKDPDEFLQKEGKEALTQKLEQGKNSFLFSIEMLEKQFQLSDPAQKVNFYKSIAKELCTQFSEEVERDTYMKSVAHHYMIEYEQLKKLVISYAMTGQYKKPISLEFQKKQSQKEQRDDATKKIQRLLLTWISEEPYLYEQMKELIAPKDFVEPLYEKVATCMFEGIRENNLNPAAIISLFQDEEEQKQVASIFHTKLHEIKTIEEKTKAIQDIIVKVKQQSYEQQVSNMDSDSTAFMQAIEGKKQLEELKTFTIRIKD